MFMEDSDRSELDPTNLLDDGPAGKRLTESSNQETDEATFAKQLAKELYRRAHSGDFAALVLVADPQTLGQIRPTLHKEVQDRLVSEDSYEGIRHGYSKSVELVCPVAVLSRPRYGRNKKISSSDCLAGCKKAVSTNRCSPKAASSRGA
ncbi:MAG: host attachment protein [Gammaproteobacteria bacterium]